MDSTYSGSYGRIKAARTEFLSEGFIASLYDMDVDAITRALSAKAYKEDIDALYATYKNPELLEMAINRRLVRRNRIARFAPPPNASDMVKAYLSKWDIQNIKSAITARYLGYSLRQSETFLVSFRDVPMGVFAGNMTADDFNILLNQPGMDSLIETLSRFGYGPVLMQEMEAYRKEGDVAPMLHALDRFYYRRLFASLRFYLGNEGPLLRYFREDVDAYSIMVLLTAKQMGVPFEKIRESLMPYGTLSMENIQSLYGSESVEEIAVKLSDKFGTGNSIAEYRENGGLSVFESSLRLHIYEKYYGILASQSISIGSVFAFVFRAERERDVLRSIVTSRVYGIEPQKITTFAGGA